MFETIAGTFAKNYAYNLIVKGNSCGQKMKTQGKNQVNLSFN